jgi:hypothetical protein
MSFIDEEFEQIADTIQQFQINRSVTHDGKIYNRLDDYLEVSNDVAKLAIKNSGG